MFRAALWSRSSDKPHEHDTQRSESVRDSHTTPHFEQVFDVNAGSTKQTVLPASAALQDRRSAKYPQEQSRMLLERKA